MSRTITFNPYIHRGNNSGIGPVSGNTGERDHSNPFESDYKKWDDSTSGFSGFWKSIKDGGYIPILMFLASALGGSALGLTNSKLSGFGLGSLFGSKMSKQSSDNDALLKSLYGDAFKSSSESNQSGWLKSIFSNLFNSGSGSFGNGLLSGLLGIGSDYASSLLNMSNMKELIDYQNQYNTPVNQMQRFADAGLNPNLIYGMGSNGNQPASGSIAPVDFSTAQRENRLANMQIALQTKQVEADIAQKMAYTRLLDTQQQGESLNNTYNAQTMNERVFMVTKQVDQLCNSVELQIKEINNWDDFREAQMTLMQAQSYAAYLSGHSIFGKVTKEIKELGKKLIDKAKVKFPNASEQFSDMWNGLISDFDSIYE